MEAHTAEKAGPAMRPGLGVIVRMRLLGMPPTGLALARRIEREDAPPSGRFPIARGG